MSATEPQTQEESGTLLEGRITDWHIGGVRPWATLHVDFGPLKADVAMSSREAREFAIAVIAEQGPHLGYQPGNDQMREVPRVQPFTGSSRARDRISRHDKRAVDIAQQSIEAALSDLRKRFGDDVVAWAVQRVTD
jgi:hypothetical protein